MTLTKLETRFNEVGGKQDIQPWVHLMLFCSLASAADLASRSHSNGLHPNIRFTINLDEAETRAAWEAGNPV